MRISYDDRTDLLDIRLDERRQPVENVRTTEDVVLDMGKSGKIVGIEILEASKHVNLRGSRNGVQTLLSSVTQGRVEILVLTAEDASAIGEILDKYHDQGFDLADACLMRLAERERIEHIFTLGEGDGRPSRIPARAAGFGTRVKRRKEVVCSRDSSTFS